MDQEKRKNNREFAYGYVEISYKHKNARGLLFNKGKNGIGVFIHEPLEIDTNIKIICDKHWEGVRRASVIWCRQFGDDLYKAGLSFN